MKFFGQIIFEDKIRMWALGWRIGIRGVHFVISRPNGKSFSHLFMLECVDEIIHVGRRSLTFCA